MFPRLIAIVLALAVLACGSSRPARPRRPGQDVLVAIRIEGNEAIEGEALIRGLSLERARQGGRGLDDYQLDMDISRIAGAYQRRGFLSVKVEPQVERRGDEVTLVLVVTEGPRATASVEITGLPSEIPLDEARSLIPVEDGEPFRYASYAAGKQPLLSLLQERGYAHAQLDAAALADRQNNQVTLRYAVDAGPRVTFGEVEVVGASGALADAIVRQANILPGDTYSPTALAEAQQAIRGIGRFTSVRVDVDRGNLATVVPVKVTVVQAKQWEARGGVGAGLDTLTYQARLRFALTHAGWPTPLTTLGGEFRPALTALRDNCTWYEVWTCQLQPRIRLLGTVVQQDLFHRGVRFDAEGGLDYLALEAYTMQGARLRLGLSRSLWTRRIQARIGWQLAGYDFIDLSPAVDPTYIPEIDRAAADDPTLASRLRIDRFQRLGAFTQGIVFDYRDAPASPRKGFYGELRIAEGTAFAGGAFDYVQVTPDLRAYLPLGRNVLAARARLGVIRGDVAPTERYYAGGATSQRGFAERRLSPTASGSTVDGTPVTVVIGGAASFETGVELRSTVKPFGYKLGVAVFLDGADVTETPSQLALGNLHWAAGVGFRPVYLPVGPIRLDIGYRLNRTGPGNPQPGDRWTWFLSVGEAY